ncbi:MAG: sigma-70 family RNA polymerase sigma factor [Deltaproteobacteria bacterium]|nr:sigma-70 family RNA polymerase sigma factor [Deltaproteobacteria bacterium]
MRAELPSDQDLIQRFLSGSTQSFEELISRYEAKAFNLAMRLTRNAQDAEEVLQDVFVTLYKKLSSFKGDSAFSSWLYRITVNASFMKLRKSKRQLSIPLEDSVLSNIQSPLAHMTSQAKTDERVILGELKNALQIAIDRLDDEYKAVFVLRDIDGLSNQEVSEILSLTIPAVKSRLHRSRLMLRRRLKHVYDNLRAEQPYFVTLPISLSTKSARIAH